MLSHKVKGQAENRQTSQGAYWEALREYVHLRHSPAQEGENECNDKGDGDHRSSHLKGDAEDFTGSADNFNCQPLTQMSAPYWQYEVGSLESRDHPVMQVQRQ